MPNEALVCPNCRTWVEGSGRVVRCPACGTRFRASEARLDKRKAAAGDPQHDHRMFDYPEEYEVGATTAPPRERGEGGWRLPESHEDHPMAWPDSHDGQRHAWPEADDDREHEWGTSDHAHDDWSHHESMDGSQAEEQRSWLNPSMLITLVILGLIIFGNRFMSGEMVIGLLLLLVASQWLLRRSERGE